MILQCIVCGGGRYELPSLDEALFLPFIGYALLAMFALMLLRPYLPMFLQARPGCCPRCRYDLSGNPDAGCPECGWGRDGETKHESASSG